jgi:hypothetical protein
MSTQRQNQKPPSTAEPAYENLRPARTQGGYKGALRDKVFGEIASDSAKPDWKAIKAKLVEMARKYDGAGPGCRLAPRKVSPTTPHVLHGGAFCVGRPGVVRTHHSLTHSHAFVPGEQISSCHGSR